MKSYFLRHAVSILLLPVVVIIAIPAFILWRTHQLNYGWGLSNPMYIVLTLLGLFFLCGGLVLMIQTIALFFRIGSGTLAPWDPPQKLVVQGPYRYVRNPMISGVIAVLMGEAILFGSNDLLFYFLFVTLLNTIYIPILEEPGLQERFGEAYRIYKQHVPRWIPRLKPWEGER